MVAGLPLLDAHPLGTLGVVGGGTAADVLARREVDEGDHAVAVELLQLVVPALLVAPFEGETQLLGGVALPRAPAVGLVAVELLELQLVILFLLAEGSLVF